MDNRPLFHKNFTLMVIGQIASLFGNAILRFALSLYVLDKTGSAAAFGSILALSMIPTVLLSPVGGILADRVSRRNIMVALDFTTSALIGGFTLLFQLNDSIFAIAVVMMLLATIQSFYQPAVQASIPSLASGDNLMKANGVVVQVNALANLLGPILGGFLYGFWGLTPILYASMGCFFLSAVMELFLKIPFTKPANRGGFLKAAGADFKEALRFLVHDQPVLFKLLFLLCGLNLFLASMVTVGLPYMIKIFLGLSDQLYGFAEAALAAGTILGGCLVGLFSKRLRFSRSYRFLLAGSLMLVPLGLAVVSNALPLLCYAVILISVLLCMAFASVFNIVAQTFAQQQTPTQLLGKVTSFITVIVICALPLGQAMYGLLFDCFSSSIYVVVLFAAAASVLMTLAARKSFRKLEDYSNSKAPV